MSGSSSTTSINCQKPNHIIKYGYVDFIDSSSLMMPDIERLHSADTIIVKYKRCFYEYKNKKYIFDIWPSSASILFAQKGDSLYLAYSMSNSDTVKILPPGVSDTTLFVIPKIRVPEELKNIIVLPTKYSFAGNIETRRKNKRHVNFYSFDIDMRNKCYVLLYEN